jgi:hypothetical protein
MINWLRTYFVASALAPAHKKKDQGKQVVVYVSGGMSGLPDFNFPAFHRAAVHLRSVGYAVVNPAEMDELHPGESMTWEQYLRRDIKALMDCSHIAMLPGWEKSRGARLEHMNATELGMTVMFLNDQGEVA